MEIFFRLFGRLRVHNVKPERYRIIAAAARIFGQIVSGVRDIDPSADMVEHLCKVLSGLSSDAFAG